MFQAQAGDAADYQQYKDCFKGIVYQSFASAMPNWADDIPEDFAQLLAIVNDPDQRQQLISLCNNPTIFPQIF